MFFKYIQSKKNGWNTPKIFYFYWVICCAISVNDAIRISSFAVYPYRVILVGLAPNAGSILIGN